MVKMNLNSCEWITQFKHLIWFKVPYFFVTKPLISNKYMTDIEKQVCNETIFNKSCKPGRDFLHTCKSWLSFTDFDLQ